MERSPSETAMGSRKDLFHSISARARTRLEGPKTYQMTWAKRLIEMLSSWRAIVNARFNKGSGFTSPIEQQLQPYSGTVNQIRLIRERSGSFHCRLLPKSP